jgi:O-antigen/teichoic acid export membrane protein
MTVRGKQNLNELSQNGRLGFLLKDSVLYGGASALSKAFALITFPLLARGLSVTDYGVLDYCLVLASLLTIFFVFGQDSAVARYFYDFENAEDQSQLITQSLIFQFAWLVVLLPIMWLSAEWWTRWIIDTADGASLGRIIILKLPFLLLINFSQNLLKWTFARLNFLILSLGYSLFQVGVLIISIKVFETGVLGILKASLISDLIFGTLGLIYVRKWVVRPKTFQHLANLIPFAFPYGIICIMSTFSPTLERIIISNLFGYEQLGYYAVATKIAMLIALAVRAFQTAWGPFAISLYQQEDAIQTYNSVLKIFSLSICIGTLLITLAAEPLIQILASERYADSSILIFPIVMSLGIQATSWITEIGISISKRSYYSLYSYSISIIITFVGVIFMTQFLGLLGVGFGVLAGQIVQGLVASALAQRGYKLSWDYSPVTGMISLTLVIGIIATWARYFELISISNGILIVGLLLLPGLGWLVVLRYDEREQFYSLVKGRLSTKV